MPRASVSRALDVGGLGVGANYSIFHDMTGTKYVSSWTATDTWRILNSSALQTVTQEVKGGRNALKFDRLDDSSTYPFVQVQFTRPQYTSAMTLGPGQETLSVLLWADDPALLATIQNVVVYLDNGAGAVDGTNYLQSSATSVITQTLGGGWFLVSWNLRQMTPQGTAATTWANLARGKVWSVVLRFQNGLDPNYSEAKTRVWVGGIFFGGSRVQPRLVLSFDGCYISHKNRILPDLQALGIPGTLYIARHKLGAGSGYFAESDIDTFYNAGWAVGEHSNAYATGYDNTSNFPTAQSIIDDSGNFQEWQLRRGWTRGLGHKAWPYSSLGTLTTTARRTLVCGALTQCGFKTIRTTIANNGTSVCGRVGGGIQALETVRPRTLFSPQMVSGLTPAQAMAYITTTAGLGMNPHLYAHEVTVSGGAGGGDGINTPVGSNYWIKSDWDSFLPLLVAVIKQGIVLPGTIDNAGY